MKKDRYKTNLDWAIRVLEIAAERAKGESRKDFLTFKAILIRGDKEHRLLTDTSQKKSLLPDKKKIRNKKSKKDGKNI